MAIKNESCIVKEVQLISILAPGNAFTAEELAQMLEVSTTSVYRYLFYLKEGGLPYVYENRHYRLATDVSDKLRRILYFTEEEANALYQAINAIHNDALFKPNLLNKLIAFADLVCPPRCTIKAKHASNIHAISEAIKERKQVIFHDYSSPSSNSVRDRFVEPYGFTTNYAEIWCYDVDDRKNKTFKTARIGKAEVLPTSWQYGRGHRKGFIDVFRMSGYDRTRVRLRLGVMAYNLLIEEYPLAENDIQPIDDTHWILDTYIANLRGVGRFVIGLADDIKIIDSPELVQYINDYVSKNLSNL